ncbi:MAG: c-type cytochrome [Bacteroidota bacterium]|nr:c-type cytochrome [Bacteroidota bacterium]MDP4234630.1 c-type cytochrome [Bacteroidota bacterium]MDP4243771.1 c-type cytochrome [Bacteroidota bacterium]MDP4289327.1 c-type cytochrome [Bacteroidota bacterium]
MKIRFAFLFLILVGAFAFRASDAQAQADSTKPIPKGNPLAEFEHPKNLKIFPKTIAPKDLQMAMRTFSRSLGVRCGFCHAALKPESDRPPMLDFASDAKDEKRNARKMYHMVEDINRKYLKKMDKSFEEISCVSCHHGRPKPIASVDSLPTPPQPKRQ